MAQGYTQKEKERILQELQIIPLNGMINSQQAACILSKRAELETGKEHSYGNDAIRWRVKTKKLNIAMPVNNRLNLFYVDDIFQLDLEPQKWHSEQRKRNQFSKKSKTST